MNLLNTLRRIFDPEGYYDPDTSDQLRKTVDDSRKKNSDPSVPCNGSLQVKDWCRGCYFEREHTGKR